MAIKDDLLEKLEKELHMLAVPPSEASGEIAQQFGTMCVIKNVLEKMPLTEEQLDMLLYMPDPLKSIETLWLDPSRDNQTIAEAVNDYLIGAAPEYRCILLNEKMSAEREQYLAGVIDCLKKSDKISPADLLSVAYEMALKQEIYLLLENHDAKDDRMIELLLSADNLLDGIYQEWLHNDLSLDDLLLETMDGFLHRHEKHLRSQYEYGGKLPDYIVERFENETQSDPDDELLEDLEP